MFAEGNHRICSTDVGGTQAHWSCGPVRGSCQPTERRGVGVPRGATCGASSKPWVEVTWFCVKRWVMWVSGAKIDGDKWTDLYITFLPHIEGTSVLSGVLVPLAQRTWSSVAIAKEE